MFLRDRWRGDRVIPGCRTAGSQPGRVTLPYLTLSRVRALGCEWCWVGVRSAEDAQQKSEEADI